jgi:enoyl-CoA hydratase/carnithine racemase
MTQDRVSGAAANEWGLITARAIAPKIGAVMKGRTSNEALLDGKTVVIKCAAKATDSVGVTYKMLNRLDSILGAFQLDDGSFELWSLSPEHFQRGMRDTRSKRSAGKVGIVRRVTFEKHGTLLTRVRL